jgi:hypothetical protein
MIRFKRIDNELKVFDAVSAQSGICMGLLWGANESGAGFCRPARRRPSAARQFFFEPFGT